MYSASLRAVPRDLDPVQRRNGGVHPPRVHERAHVAEEQGEQEGADVGAVDVGVRHDDDLAVARLVEVEGLARAGSDHLDDARALGVVEHVRHRRLLDVEDLAADGQERLEVASGGRAWPCRGRCPPRR